jgi:hypothetical protein
MYYNVPVPQQIKIKEISGYYEASKLIALFKTLLSQINPLHTLTS